MINRKKYRVVPLTVDNSNVVPMTIDKGYVVPLTVGDDMEIGDELLPSEPSIHREETNW